MNTHPSPDICACGHDKDQWHAPNGLEPMACHHHTRAFCPCAAFTPAQPATEDDNHGGRGWEATETGWRCTECHHEVAVVDVNIDAAHRCPASEVPDNVTPLFKPRPLSDYRGVTFPKHGDGPIAFPNREVLREYIAEHRASALYEVDPAGIERVLGEHRPVIGRFAHLNGVVGCQCMDRVFVAHQEDYPSHVASQVIAYLHRKDDQ